MTPLILHLLGDYVLQSDWMALNKQKRFWPCFWHCLLYTLPFLIITQSVLALTFIFVTHFAIDRIGAARYIVWLKNHLAPRDTPREERRGYLVIHTLNRYQPWEECSGTGYHKDRPAWLTVWLLIAADNTIHLICNQIAIAYL